MGNDSYQEEGSIIAQVVINPFTDAIISSWGFDATLAVITAKREWTILMNQNMAAVDVNSRSVICTIRQPTPAAAADYRTVSEITRAGDVNAMVRIAIFDQAGAPGDAITGSVIVANVMRCSVPSQ